MGANEYSDWTFPEPDDESEDGGWRTSYTRPSEAVDSYRVSEEDMAKLAETFGLTLDDFHTRQEAAVSEWERLTMGQGGNDRLAERGIGLTRDAEWIPGGEWGYYFEIDADGSRVDTDPVDTDSVNTDGTA
jgi:hypothetical protein